MADLMFAKIPAYEFHCNLVVCPLPPAEPKNVSSIKIIKIGLNKQFAVSELHLCFER